MIKRRRNRSSLMAKLGTVCLAMVIVVGIMGVSYAAWVDYIHIHGTVTTGDWEEELGGTIGFWGAWNNHNTYPVTQIEAWLENIDADSDWLGPTTTSGMEDCFNAGTGPNAEKRFLAHYLATRLNAESERLSLTMVRDISGYDPANYLGLAGSGTLPEIFIAMEAKFGSSPSTQQYNLMKDICDGLNNVNL